MSDIEIRTCGSLMSGIGGGTGVRAMVMGVTFLIATKMSFPQIGRR
jgi:hypothetical protein